mmetsp:Transcript_10584/g.65118  ORF Transcript_10584/g.65118 Transcript_10584/m.65118 type:complete len:323 (+) Transcript_10584:3169-4137(+)
MGGQRHKTNRGHCNSKFADVGGQMPQLFLQGCVFSITLYQPHGFAPFGFVSDSRHQYGSTSFRDLRSSTTERITLAFLHRLALASQRSFVHAEMVRSDEQAVRHNLVAHLQHQHIATDHVSGRDEILPTAAHDFDRGVFFRRVQLSKLLLFLVVVERSDEGDGEHCNPDRNSIDIVLVPSLFGDGQSQDQGKDSSCHQQSHGRICKLFPDNGQEPLDFRMSHFVLAVCLLTFQNRLWFGVGVDASFKVRVQLPRDGLDPSFLLQQLRFFARIDVIQLLRRDVKRDSWTTSHAAVHLQHHVVQHFFQAHQNGKQTVPALCFQA